MKKILTLLLIFLVSLIIVNSVETVISYEELRFDLIRTDPSPLEPGKNFDIWFDVTNLQSYTLKNVQISIVDKFPFSIRDTTQRSILIGDIKPGEKKSIKYGVDINRDIDEGTYQIALQYFSNKLDVVVSKNFNLDVKSVGTIVTPTDIRLNPERISPGSSANLEVDVINTASSTITDITAELGLEGTPFVTLGETSEKKIRQLAQNAKATLSYSLIVNPSAESKVYRIPLEITYYDRLGAKFTRNNTIGISVYANPEYNLDLENTEVFVSRQVGEITISIANKGNSELKFLSIELLEDDNYNILSNPRIYVGNLDSDDFETATYDIYTKSSRPINLRFNVEYKDSYNEKFLDTMEVKLPLYNRITANNMGLVKINTFWINLIIFILILIFSYKVYKVWKHERDLEKSVIIVYENAKSWFKKKTKILNFRKSRK